MHCLVNTLTGAVVKYRKSSCWRCEKVLGRVQGGARIAGKKDEDEALELQTHENQGKSN